MTICANCGVELDDELKVCPLCGKNPGNNRDMDQHAFNYPSDIIQIHKKENRKYLWELSGIIAFSGIAVCTIVNLLTGKRLGWSLFADVFIMAAWITLTLFLYTFKRTVLLVSGLLLTILAVQFLIDLIDTPAKWFFPVGFPLTVAALFAVGIVIILYRAAHLKGFNIIASALIVVAGFCIITEVILDKYVKGFVHLRWSLIEAISILPLTLILFFYHYRLKKGNHLDRFFHI